jgi:putative transposase
MGTTGLEPNRVLRKIPNSLRKYAGTTARACDPE